MMREASPIRVNLSLSDGRRVLLRPVQPTAEDRQRIRGGLERLSSSSRYLRFFTPTPQLSDDQLRYLTEIDQVNHVAWCALDPDVDGLPGIGLSRYVRLEDEPHVAEMAMAIIDACQGKGLGRMLLGLLYLKARENGIRVLRGLVLPENQHVLRWFANLGGTVRREEGFNRVDLPVHCEPAALPETPSARRFAQVLRELQGAMTNDEIRMTNQCPNDE